nr:MULTISPECIES: prepilin-type N-terminal cleavage/methylation domain-containing protein [unclassified Exiguobacterium]
MGMKQFVIKIRNESKGVTLVELLVTVVISSIVIIVLANILTGLVQFNQSEKLRDHQTAEMRLVIKMITTDVRRSNTFEMNSSALTVNSRTYKESNGVIYRNNEVIARGVESLTFNFKDQMLTIDLKLEGVNQPSKVVTTKLFIGEGVAVENLE